MTRILSEDLLDQFRKAISMVRFTIEEFDDEQWTSGISWFETPARVAHHTIDALDFYFSGKREDEELESRRRFGGPWWTMTDAQLPKKEALLEYLGEVEQRIEDRFQSLQDEHLSAPFELYDWSGKTLLGHFVYALRHTMHHQGASTVLSTHHGHEEESWV